MKPDDSDSDEPMIMEEKKPEKPAGSFDSAIEAEIKAARERANTPIEIRIKQFKEMLREKEVNGIRVKLETDLVMPGLNTHEIEHKLAWIRSIHF